MNKMCGYFSHYIRGAKGLEATNEDMDRNRLCASYAAKELKCLIPEIDLYVPADNDKFVQFGYEAGLLSEQLILDVDCAIIDALDFVIFYDPACRLEQSRGMRQEYTHALRTGKKFVHFDVVTQDVATKVREMLASLNASKKEGSDSNNVHSDTADWYWYKGHRVFSSQFVPEVIYSNSRDGDIVDAWRWCKIVV